MDVGHFQKGPKGKGKKGKDGGKKGDSKGTNKGSNQKGNSGKGKGPGSGSGGQETRTCHNCGKTGHLKKECWSAGGGAANKNQKPKQKTSGKSGKGGGEKYQELEEAENDEQLKAIRDRIAEIDARKAVLKEPIRRDVT